MTKTLFTLDFGQVTLKFSGLADAFRVCTARPKVRVEGPVKHDRVSFGVRLPDNILSHVLVLSRLSYTFDFPFELAKDVSLDKLSKMASSRLKAMRYGFCWRLSWAPTWMVWMSYWGQ
ncbi:MAG: hypothetical protein DRO11_05405 [Methanobacteriota archaeon]|nr:MAG: hypothetical protein DRO11_05405 [Euryarchaeota archaeon]